MPPGRARREHACRRAADACGVRRSETASASLPRVVRQRQPTGEQLQADIDALQRFRDTYRDYLATAAGRDPYGLDVDPRELAADSRARLFELMPAAERAIEHSRVKMALRPPASIGGPPVTDLRSQVFAHESPPFLEGGALGGRPELPATARLLLDSIAQALGQLRDQQQRLGAQPAKRTVRAARRPTIFGHIARLKPALALAADLIAVVTFVLATGAYVVAHLGRESSRRDATVVGFVGGCPPFQIYAQNRWEPYGTAVRAKPSNLATIVATFPGNMSLSVNGWVHGRVAYADNRPPFDSDIWFHLSDDAGWVSYAGVRALPTARDPTGVADGGPPAPHPPKCEGGLG